MRERIIMGAVGVVALGLIAYGGFLAWKPLGFLAPGLLLWLDVSMRRR